MTTREEHAFADAAWGDTEPEPEAWRAGAWSLELRGDELADIAFDGRTVLRAVRAVARDRDWGTVPVQVLEASVKGPAIDLDLRMTGLGADLRGRLRVEADGDRLHVDFACISGTDFLRNRIGLVVLHPPTVAGDPLSVTHPDGARTDGWFPDSISPHQPAFDIRRLEWEHEGCAVRLDFEGEIFEMEDQRNWSDASFKTYSTPLAAPVPVLVPAGSEIRQSLTLAVRRAAPAAASRRPDRVVLEDAGHTVPSISVGASTAPDPSPEPGELTADALLVELDLTTGSWRAALDRARRDAGDRPLDVRLVSRADIELAEAVTAIARLDVVRVGIYDAESHVTEMPLWRALTAALAGRAPRPELVGGARSHFTELNRNHTRLPADLEGITFSVTPQMHARERSQLVESIAMQRQVALDAVRIADGRPVHAGPVTLRPRFNAVATSGAGGGKGSDLSHGYGAALAEATDSRQPSEALLAWTIASAAALSVPGVSSLCYFEQWGERGLRGTDGAPYPVQQAIAWLHELSGLPMLAPREQEPAGVWTIAARAADTVVVLAANLAPRPRTIRLALPGIADVGLELDGLGTVRRTFSLGSRSTAR